MIRYKHHSTWVGTLIPQPTLKRPMQPRARSAGRGGQQALDQSEYPRITIALTLLSYLYTARLKRSRAIDPFASSSMVHSGATGLTNDWRTKIQSPYSITPLQSMALDLGTPERNTYPYSPMTSTPTASVSPLSFLSVCYFPYPPPTHPPNIFNLVRGDSGPNFRPSEKSGQDKDLSRDQRSSCTHLP